MKNKKNQFTDSAKLKNIIFYIFAFVIFMVPLIVKLKVFTVPDYVLKYYPPDKTFDFFTYYKAMLLITGTAVIFPLVVYYRYKIGNKIKFDLVAKLHLAFGASILLSTLFSSYKQVAFFGFFNKNEGAFTWWAYLLLSYSIYLFVESKAEVTKFVKVIVASTTTISIIGLFQFIGLDYIKFDWIQRLIYGPYYAQIKATGVTLMFSDKTVYSTVANPNYIGSVMALAIPLILYLFMESKNRQEKLIAGGLALLHLFVLVASKSTAGLLAVGLTMGGYGVYRLIVNKRIKLLVSGAAAVILVIGAIAYSGLIDAQIGKIISLIDINQATVNPFEKVEIDGTRIKFTDKAGDHIVVNHSAKMLWVEDENQKILSAKMDNDGWLYRDKKWLVNYKTDSNILNVYIYDASINKYYVRQVYLTFDGYTLFSQSLTNEQLKTSKYNLFKNELFLSKRGYIWNRTLPLIVNRPLIGHGPDSFILSFPQNDILDKPSFNLIVDKPHNLFLQIAFNFGLAGFVVFIFMVIIACRNYKRFELVLALSAFMIAGMANDSTVYTSVLYFSVLGLIYLNDMEAVYEK